MNPTVSVFGTSLQQHAARGGSSVANSWFTEDARAGDAVQQGGLAGVRIADDGHRHPGAPAPAPLEAALLAHLVEFPPQLGHPPRMSRRSI